MVKYSLGAHENAITKQLRNIRSGETVVYFKGFNENGLNYAAKVAWDFQEQKSVYLFQRRLTPGKSEFEYIAIGR